jgi:hypothetical protein
MDFTRMNIQLYGEPGAGKTTNSRELCIKHAEDIGTSEEFKALILDFDNLPLSRAEDNIFELFPDYTDAFDVWGVLQRPKDEIIGRKGKRKDLYKDLSRSHSVDYYQSFLNLQDTIIPALEEHLSEYNYLIVDAVFPKIRNDIGKAVWMKEHTDRVSPVEADWVEITPIEELIFNELVGLAKDCRMPVVFTGQMTDAYRTSIDEKGKATNFKDGRKIGAHDKVAYSASAMLEIIKPELKRGRIENTDFKVICRKSCAGIWMGEIQPGTVSLYDVLKKYKVIT